MNQTPWAGGPRLDRALARILPARKHVLFIASALIFFAVVFSGLAHVFLEHAWDDDEARQTVQMRASDYRGACAAVSGFPFRGASLEH